MKERDAQKSGLAIQWMGELSQFRKQLMTEPTLQARIVLTTAASHDEAARLASTLVEERLAACATLFPAVESIYRWEGQVESSTETLLLLKTAADQLGALEARLHELHSYQVPEFLVLNVESGSHAYLQWLLASLKKPEHPAVNSAVSPALNPDPVEPH
jgi:periplasmic divalent cation tolerance protein